MQHIRTASASYRSEMTQRCPDNFIAECSRYRRDVNKKPATNIAFSGPRSYTNGTQVL